SRNACFDVVRRDSGDKAPFKAAAQPVLESRTLLWWTGARNDDLLVVLMQCIERMEECRLCRFLACEELYIVNQQYIHIPVPVPEGFGLVVPDGVYELIREFFTGQVGNFCVRPVLQHIMSDGMHQVRLAETDTSVYEKRIIRFGRRLSNGE